MSLNEEARWVVEMNRARKHYPMASLMLANVQDPQRSIPCFTDRRSRKEGRLLSFGRNPVELHDVVLPLEPGPGVNDTVTRTNHQNYQDDHFFFFLAPSGEIILGDQTRRHTAIEANDLDPDNSSLFALQGEARQRVIPRVHTHITITVGTSTLFRLV